VRARRLAALAAAIALLAQGAIASPRTQVHWVMGTWLRISASGDGAAAAMDDCFRDARLLDRTFSRWDPESELSRVHAADRRQPLVVSAATNSSG
jgi:thiamine biosynthesis lipoprotein ApbE